MTTTIRSDAAGYGALQVGGSDVLRFGSDNSGHLAGFRNKIINGSFAINQRAYVSGVAVGSGLYGHDRWKQAASADTYTFATVGNKTTVTIPVGKVLRQVIEGLNLQTGTYILSWEGTAQGKIGAGDYGSSGITASITGGVDTTIEFGPGTVANVQLEMGSIATPFEHRPIVVELSLCQRYFIKHPGPLSVSSVIRSMVYFPVTMRAVPTTVGTLLAGGAIGFDYISSHSFRAGSANTSDFSYTASAEL